jgi:hypothetical protein
MWYIRANPKICFPLAISQNASRQLVGTFVPQGRANPGNYRRLWLCVVTASPEVAGWSEREDPESGDCQTPSTSLSMGSAV